MKLMVILRLYLNAVSLFCATVRTSICIVLVGRPLGFSNSRYTSLIPNPIGFDYTDSTFASKNYSNVVNRNLSKVVFSEVRSQRTAS